MYRMYVLVNTELGMSIGKTAAQVAHAVARIRSNKVPHTVIVLEATTEQLHNLHQYLNDRNVQSHLYIDEGVNEIEPFSVTALAVEPLREPSGIETFSGFNLLREKSKWYQKKS